MDAKVATAGVAMALGMMLLLPTFNALNNSFVENVQPPPWIPTPNEIPEDFVPPEDWEPPPDWVPPEGWEPPPDWEPPEGWEPPPGYEGPIPPGGCPPPVFQWMPPSNETLPMPSQLFQGTWTERIAFNAPKYTVGVSAAVNFTNWRAPEVRSILELPTGETTTMQRNQSADGTLLFGQTQANPRAQQVHQLIAQDADTMPPEGRYSFTLSAPAPVTGGSYQVEIVVAIACGGMLS